MTRSNQMNFRLPHSKLLPLHSHKLLRCCDSNNMIEMETNLFDTKLFQYKFDTNSSSETVQQ